MLGQLMAGPLRWMRQCGAPLNASVPHTVSSISNQTLLAGLKQGFSGCTKTELVWRRFPAKDRLPQAKLKLTCGSRLGNGRALWNATCARNALAMQHPS
jgi:hypothetical protein